MLKYLVIIFSLWHIPLFAEEVQRIERVDVVCVDQDEQCSAIANKFEDFIGLVYSPNIIKERMSFKLIDHPFEKFEYRIIKEDQILVLEVEAQQKKTIRRLEIKYNADVTLPSLATYIPIKVGDYFDETRRELTQQSLLKFLGDRGFITPEIKFIVNERSSDVDILIDVQLKSVTRISDVLIATSNPNLLGRVRQKFSGFKGQVLDRLQFKLAVDLLSRELFESGFYDSEVTVLPDELVGKDKVILRIQINYGSLHSFHFRGNHYLSRSEILDVLNSSIRQNLTSMNNDELLDALTLAYKEKGFYKTEIKLRTANGRNSSDLDYVNYFFNISEGHKVKLRELSFNGNISISNESLENLYYEEASVLASRSYLDESYLDQFKEKLNAFYLSRGHVLVDVGQPVVTFFSDDEARVKFTIRERQRANFAEINIQNIDKKMEKEIKKTLINKTGRSVDVTSLDKDLQTIEDSLHMRGHYFAEIENIDDENLLTYSANYTEAKLDVKVKNQQLTKLNSVIITGFDKTKNKVLSREIVLKEGDIITPAKVAKLRDSLVSLDLFASVRVTPFIVDERSSAEELYINLVVQVVEKAFGVIEFAPGYRTDLGAKASLGITYNNIQGMNRSAAFSLEANRRFDYSDFDTRRREEEREVIEYNVRTSFTEPFMLPNLLPTKIQFDAGLSFQRKRFVSFDADILRISPQLSKTFWEKLTLSLKYQFETINQFDATNPDFNDNFTIGSITPSVTLDLRNDAVRPTKGAYLGLNWEFANPYFLSMDDEDIVVNYYRLTSRNHFYFSLSDSLTLAISLAGGVQKNFANQAKLDDDGNPLRDDSGRIIREGFIPSTKVFRLDGIDTVRGYSGEEINRISNGQNIGEVVVDDLAYFVNFKFEPRYYMNDALAVGLFYDAGRVFVNDFEALDLKSSSGLTFKILTPVGSLDFDYGVKLKRERDDAGGRESFGRFHLSIGFF